jgi:hypothetical protein
MDDEHTKEVLYNILVHTLEQVEREVDKTCAF